MFTMFCNLCICALLFCKKVITTNEWLNGREKKINASLANTRCSCSVCKCIYVCSRLKYITIITEDQEIKKQIFLVHVSKYQKVVIGP